MSAVSKNKGFSAMNTRKSNPKIVDLLTSADGGVSRSINAFSLLWFCGLYEKRQHCQQLTIKWLVDWFNPADRGVSRMSAPSAV